MMVDREVQIKEFLVKANWSKAVRTPLAGDASSRRYERLSNGLGGQNAILMDAPPDTNPTLGAFLAVANHLLKLGFSPPEILHSDRGNGFLLLEDLGDALFAKLASEPGKEQEIYDGAVDFLIDLHQHPAPETCRQYSAKEMSGFAGLVFEYYAPSASAAGKEFALQLLSTALEQGQTDKPVLALRDFHSENLIWLPERSGVKRIGLLDFQDAIIAHPAYDLISLTTDARRDVSPALSQHLIQQYISKSGVQKDAFLAAAAAIAVQRNLRILGIFCRLAMCNQKPAYIDLIPRVWAHLLQCLSHPSLASLQTVLLAELPIPTPTFLQNIRNKCQNNLIQS